MAKKFTFYLLLWMLAAAVASMAKEATPAPDKVFPLQLTLNIKYHENMKNPTSKEFKEAAEKITGDLGKMFNVTDTPTTTAAPTTTTVAPTTTTAAPTTTTAAPTTTTAAPTTTTVGTTTTTAATTTTTAATTVDPTTTTVAPTTTTTVAPPGAPIVPEASKKVFPRQSALSSEFDEKISDTISKDFQEVGQKKTIDLNEMSIGTDYTGSRVLRLKRSSRSGDFVDADVEISFKGSSSITAADVIEKLENPKTSCPDCEELKDSEFIILCNDGETANNEGECEPCSFGYTGFNCQEAWKLSLVIVATVCGGLLVVATTVLSVLASKSTKKKKSKKSKTADATNSHNGSLPAKMPLVNSSFANNQVANGQANGGAAFVNEGVPRIPRATANSGWDSRTNLEMTVNPYSRQQSGAHSQTRPQNNPYAQNRSQMNPYAQSQGRPNPNYVDDERRRFH